MLTWGKIGPDRGGLLLLDGTVYPRVDINPICYGINMVRIMDIRSRSKN